LYIDCKNLASSGGHLEQLAGWLDSTLVDTKKTAYSFKRGLD